jgi:MSHA biogenesis protein MshK
VFKHCYLLVCLFLSITAYGQNVDPTKPLSGQSIVGTGKSEENKALILESIIHGVQRHTAVINGQILKVGDYIGEFRLVAVNNTSVVMRSSDERLKLHVFSAAVIKQK